MRTFWNLPTNLRCSTCGFNCLIETNHQQRYATVWCSNDDCPEYDQVAYIPALEVPGLDEPPPSR